MYSENGAKGSSETSQSLGVYGEQRAELISECLAGCGVSSVLDQERLLGAFRAVVAGQGGVQGHLPEEAEM